MLTGSLTHSRAIFLSLSLAIYTRVFRTSLLLSLRMILLTLSHHTALMHNVEVMCVTSDRPRRMMKIRRRVGRRGHNVHDHNCRAQCLRKGERMVDCRWSTAVVDAGIRSMDEV